MKSANADIFDVDLEQFETAVIAASHQIPMLVDFWADWCAPCIVLSPTLERVMEHWHGKIKLAKLEVDEGDNMKLAGHYRVRGFPTVILFINGEERARFTSAKPKHWIDEFLAEHLSAD